VEVFLINDIKLNAAFVLVGFDGHIAMLEDLIFLAQYGISYPDNHGFITIVGGHLFHGDGLASFDVKGDFAMSNADFDVFNSGFRYSGGGNCS
jgi:hypothetical protein